MCVDKRKEVHSTHTNPVLITRTENSSQELGTAHFMLNVECSYSQWWWTFCQLWLGMHTAVTRCKRVGTSCPDCMCMVCLCHCNIQSLILISASTLTVYFSLRRCHCPIPFYTPSFFRFITIWYVSFLSSLTSLSPFLTLFSPNLKKCSQLHFQFDTGSLLFVWHTILHDLQVRNNSKYTQARSPFVCIHIGIHIHIRKRKLLPLNYVGMSPFLCIRIHNHL